MSAVLLAVLATGLLALIDGPAAVSGQNKARSTAAALAQQDQERLHAMKTSDLSNYSETRTVTLAGVPYTVDSRAVWISDTSGTDSCTSGSKQANYLKISSSVRWPSIGAGRPVALVSLLAPGASFGQNKGNLAVQILDQAGNPVTGVPVSARPGALSIATNSEGCSFFGFLDAGTYTASFSQAGFVDPSGDQDVSLTGSVTAGATATLSDSLGRASQLSVNFDTKVGSAAPVPAQASAVTLVNSGIPGAGLRQFTVGSPQASILADNLSPFTSGYGAYTGSCGAANPTQYNSNYYTQFPGRYGNVTPGAGGSVTVREPALNVTVKRGTNPFANAHVVVTAIDSGCTDKFTMTTDSAGALVKGAAPYQAPAVPFGTYTVCADDGTYRSSATVFNTDPSGNQSATNTVVTVPTFSFTKSVCS